MSKRVERFPTEARLLSTTRPDGHQANALDTDNTYEYITGVGWTQLMPVSGVQGQALVVAENTLTVPTSGPRRRDPARIEFGSSNKFVPEGGEPGQIVNIDAEGQTELTAPTFVFVPGGVTYPVDFTSGSLTFCLDRVIPGGALGPNGFLRVTASIIMTTNAARVVTFYVTAGPSVNGLETASLSSNVNHWGIEYTLLMTNQSSETANVCSSKIMWALWTNSTTTSTSEDFQLQVGQTGALDTSVDWQLSAQIQASAAVTGEAWVHGVGVEYGYGA